VFVRDGSLSRTAAYTQRSSSSYLHFARPSELAVGLFDNGQTGRLPVLLEEPALPIVMQTVSYGPRLCENPS
jgi:hypothetical protein